MTRFEVLKRIEKEEQFADLIVGFVEQFKTPEALAEALKTELTEEGVKPQIISGDFRRLYKVEIPVTVCG